MIVLLGEKIYIDEKSFDILSFMKIINRLLTLYKNRNVEENYTVAFDDENNKSIITFKLIAIKKDEDHYVRIKSRNGIVSQKMFETLEIIAMFRKLFLHLALYMELKNDVHFSMLLNISKKDFYELVNPVVMG